jgi:NADH-quinone oxidoreductase subunit L
MVISTLVVAAGLGAGWWLYGRQPAESAAQTDPLERLQPAAFGVLRAKFFVDELYESTVVRANARFSRFCHWLDAVLLDGMVQGVAYLAIGLSWIGRWADEYGINVGFDAGCGELRRRGAWLAKVQSGQVQSYLRVVGLALAILLLLLTWGCSR